MDMSASFEGRHVVVTGGTGALGSAVVALLVERGPICHVPSHGPDAPAHFTLRDHPNVKIVSNIDLTNEASVDTFYGAIPSLWASIHTAGGFAASPIAETGKNALLVQIETNFVTSALCCRAAVAGMRRSGSGRIVNVVSRQALEWRGPRMGRAGRTGRLRLPLIFGRHRLTPIHGSAGSLRTSRPTVKASSG